VHHLAVTTAAIDRLLAVLVVALAVTGLISLRMGSPGDAWLFVLHGLLAGCLAATTGWKLVRSLPRAIAGRRWARLALALVVSLATVGTLVGGFAWVASGRLLSVGSWTVLTIHAWIGLALVPLVVIHLLPRRWRLLVPRGPRGASRSPGPSSLSRRRLLAGGVLGVASVGAVGAAQVADRLSGGERRFTGSRWLATGAIPPPTTFFGEGIPEIDPGTWVLLVGGRVGRPLRLTGTELVALGEIEVAPILDCTSGWAIETAWRGTPLGAVVAAVAPAPGARGVVVRSVTGWATQLPIGQVDRGVLARSVAGGPLPLANGAPYRLVVADRRGLDWVKWVTEIEVV
jgi:hypothetical protein